MPSLVSKIALRVSGPLVGSKRLYAQTPLPIAKQRKTDVKRPRGWMTPGCRLDAGHLGTMPSHSIVPKRTRSSDRIVLYLHGGAYVFGPLFWHWNGCAKLARKSGIRFELPDYPLAPESTFEVTIEAVVSGYRQLLETYDPSNITVMGDSAGGGLSAALMVALIEAGLPLPRRCVLISPWVDLQTSVAELAKLDERDVLLHSSGVRACALLYAGGEEQLSNPLVSPINGNLARFPELLVFNASEDILSPRSEDFAAQAKAGGVPVQSALWQGQMHAWVLSPAVPEAIQARRQIVAAITS
ncbi:MAG: alpha/beta hydrolase [Thermoleophilaceae bacterium]|nr:alpha/beta hydrolase [Thermoleophilaceae bacterium]